MQPHGGSIEKVRRSVIRIHLLGTMNLCTKFFADPYGRCFSDISQVKVKTLACWWRYRKGHQSH